MRKINVLVTGAGSGVGQSIVKALNISKLNVDIIIFIYEKIIGTSNLFYLDVLN